MRPLFTLVIVIAVIAIVSVNFLNGNLNAEFPGSYDGEFTQENFQSLSKDFKIDASKAQNIVHDPDGIPNSFDEQFLTKYEGCTFKDIDEAFEKCKIAQLKVIEKTKSGSCIGKGPGEKNYDIGPCEANVGEFVMAIIEP